MEAAGDDQCKIRQIHTAGKVTVGALTFVCDGPGTVGAEPCGPNAPLAGRDPDEDAGHTRSLGQRRTAAAVSRSTRTLGRIATLLGRRDACCSARACTRRRACSLTRAAPLPGSHRPAALPVRAVPVAPCV